MNFCPRCGAQMMDVPDTNIEGLLMGLDNERSALGYDSLAVIDEVIDEVWEEEDHVNPN